MSMIRHANALTATHHAMLFALMSRAAIQTTGETEGERVIRQAVRIYGEQRGHRMALRATANGHPLTMANFLAYSEWALDRGATDLRVVAKVPHAKVHIGKCPWHRIWTENDLLSYGRYYCLEIDSALVRGFNPELKLDVNESLSAGQSRCEFIFHDANLTLRNYLVTAYRKLVKPGKTCRMPWDYHCGHLYKTVGDTIIHQLDSTGREAVETALAEFAETCGQAAAHTVAAFKDTDFNKLSQ
jgi:hypothetical protein